MVGLMLLVVGVGCEVVFVVVEVVDVVLVGLFVVIVVVLVFGGCCSV